eukprot:2718928-Rhodomonas_salina.2
MGEQETWLLDPERQGGEGGSEEAKEGSIASSAQDREEGGEGASALDPVLDYDHTPSRSHLSEPDEVRERLWPSGRRLQRLWFDPGQGAGKCFLSKETGKARLESVMAVTPVTLPAQHRHVIEPRGKLHAFARKL